MTEDIKKMLRKMMPFRLFKRRNERRAPLVPLWVGMADSNRPKVHGPVSSHNRERA